MSEWPSILFALLTALFPGDAFAEEDTVADLIERAMEQSRGGEWADAVRTAEQVLARENVAVTQRAEALYLIASCSKRLNDTDAAAAAIAAYDELAPDLPRDSWTRAWMAKLRGTTDREPGESERPVGEGAAFEIVDVPTAIWTVRYWNSSDRYADASVLAERLLKDDMVARPEGRCDLLLHLGFALLRLEQHEAADAAFERFATEADELAAGHPLVTEMALLRESANLPPLEGLRPGRAPFRPPEEDTYWRTGDPDTVGMHIEPLEQIEQQARVSGADAILIARRGVIVREFYSPLYREPMRTMSSCKSITGLLAGILIHEEKLSLDDPISATVPSWSEGLRSEVSIRHLLTMTGGMTHRPVVNDRIEDEGWNGFAERQYPSTRPGTTWAYTNEGVQLLSPALERAAGMPLWRFAEERLFQPIGATSTKMRVDAKSATNTFADAETTLREFARFGELVRRGGEWPGQGPVVPASWITAMTTPCPLSEEYGYLWWLADEPRVWSMRGYLHTSVWVFPDEDVVVARVQSRAYLHVTRHFDVAEMMRLVVEACR